MATTRHGLCFLALIGVLFGGNTLLAAGPKNLFSVHPTKKTAATLPAPATVYGFPGPTYRWGWFGAQYRPRKTYHHGYYGTYWQWGYRAGY